MSKPLTPPKGSSPWEQPGEEIPGRNEILTPLFRARCASDLLEIDNQGDTFFRSLQLFVKLNKQLSEIEHLYEEKKAILSAEVGRVLEGNFKNAHRVYDFSKAIIPPIQKLAYDFVCECEAFRNFMGSRAFPRTYEAILEDLRDADRRLRENEYIMKLSAYDEVKEDLPTSSFYMAVVDTYFHSDFKRYASLLVSPEPIDEDISKLQEKVACTCFQGVRSLGRLYALGRYMRLRLEECEHVYLDVWEGLRIEEEERAMMSLAAARVVLHFMRENTMLLASLAMQFVHDDESDRFLAFCQEHRDRITASADNLCEAEGHMNRFRDIVKELVPDRKMKDHPSSLATDPIEMRIKVVHPNIVPGGYNVFLAHDSTQNGIALTRYVQVEIQRIGASCYMEPVPFKDFIPRFMLDATKRVLDDACVGVFLLTPDFANEKWKVMQLQHMLRRVREARLGWPGPTLIPVFYKLSVRDCRDGNIFVEAEEDVVKAFDEITRYTGIENLEGVTDEDSKEMAKRRRGLVERTACAVVEACLTMMKECSNEYRVARNREMSDEHKKVIEHLQRLIADSRQDQREARERAFLY